MPLDNAVTPKGERRRARLVAAAADVLVSSGYDAVRHRAVADRAGLPVASTTYYFESAEELIIEAAVHVARQVEMDCRERCEAITVRRRSAASTAATVAHMLVGSATDTGDLAARLQLDLLAARHPVVHDVVAQNRKVVRELTIEALRRSRRDAGQVVDQIVDIESGALARAVADRTPHAEKVIAQALTGVLDVLAPLVRRAS